MFEFTTGLPLRSTRGFLFGGVLPSGCFCLPAASGIVVGGFVVWLVFDRRRGMEDGRTEWKDPSRMSRRV